MVIAAAAIPRWFQPTPNLTSGEALLAFTGNPDATPSVSALAAAAITAPFAATAQVDATASLIYNDSLQLLPLVTATASIEFDNTGLAEDNLGVAAAIALADITATCLLDTQLQGNAVFVIFGRVEGAPVLSADAEIGFADYGQGSIPIFPFTLPVLFTDNPYGYQTGDAIVTVTGDGYDIQGAGFADAIVVIDTPGTFSQKGNTPIFPFGFPIVFDDLPANVQLGAALASITSSGEVVAQVDGDAQAAITAVVFQANPAVLPFTLPIVFV